MKKTIIIFVLLCTIAANSVAQPTLLGMNSEGGSSNFGTIFSVLTGDTVLNKVYHFASTGTFPFGDVCQASNGKLYGLTYNGGLNNKGVLFEYDLATNNYLNRKDFDGPIYGEFPQGSLIQASNGKMYGLTYAGGSNGEGVLFEFDPATNAFNPTMSFASATTGKNPQGSLIQASNGKLYGMTRMGGASNMGVIFEFNPVTSAFAKLFDFNGTTTGRFPECSLIQAANGKLYGMAFAGGSSDKGTMFEFEIATSSFKVLHHFLGPVMGDGSYPRGSLLESSNGKLYGLTVGGGTADIGIIFEYAIYDSSYVKKFDFTGTATGSSPYGSLMEASNGKFYGFANSSGLGGHGTLFEYDTVSSSFTVRLHLSAVATGSYPRGSLIQATNGKLYGLTNEGGTDSKGVLLEFDPATFVAAKKQDLSSTPAGKNPKGSLLHVASNNRYYGMTQNGGANNLGVLFEYDLDTNKLLRRFDFDGLNGEYPVGSLVQASNGKLYGMTPEGGLADLGIIFEYDPVSAVFTKIHDFTGGTNGSSPQGSLIQASNGKLYGLTRGGTPGNNGTLFEYDIAADTLITKYVFVTFSEGMAPYGSLLEASNGKLYGMTHGGGSVDDGAIFEYSISADTYTKLVDFQAYSGTMLLGSGPFGSLIQASNGKLYGMAEKTIDINGYGTLFEYSITADTAIQLMEFDYAGGEGWCPRGTPLQASNGKLYGLTGYVDSFARSGDGLFEYDINTGTYIRKLKFDDFIMNEIGLVPYGSLIETGAPPSGVGVQEVKKLNLSVSVYPNPFAYSTTVELKNADPAKRYQFELIDVLGRAVLHMTELKDSKLILTKENLNSGMYFYRISDGSSFVAAGRLQVQ